MKSWLRLLPLLLLTASFAVAQEKETKDDAKGEEDMTATEADALSEVPMGEPIDRLVIPQFSPEGKLISKFEAGTARRVDEKHIEFEKLRIQIHNSDGTTFHVEMPTAVLDLDTRILTSNSPSQIRREGFIIDGEAAEFHTKERFGRMTGKVKMIIDSDDIQ